VKRNFAKVEGLGLTENIEDVARKLSQLGIGKDDDLKLLTKKDMSKLDLPPVTKTKIENLAKSLGASLGAGDLDPWLRSIGIDEESVEDILQNFTKPEFGVTSLKILFALDNEDIDEILKGVPLGQRKLIKKSIEMEK
jgi:hypothetical protein